MPQPLNRLVPNATVSLTPDALSDKPDMAVVVAKIFATWAEIEQRLALILIRLIGGDQEVALAIYSMLQTEKLRQSALLAASKAKLTGDDNDVLIATINAANRAAGPRNQLAHWPWAICHERPDLLLLVDPELFRKKELKRAKLYKSANEPGPKIDPQEFVDLHQLDHSAIQAYGIADLKRSLRDIDEAHEVIHLTSTVLDANLIVQRLRGTPEGQEIRDKLLRTLNGKRLFREAALAIQIGKDRNSNPPKTGG